VNKITNNNYAGSKIRTKIQLKKQNKTLIKVYAINKEDALQRIFRQYQKS